MHASENVTYVRVVYTNKYEVKHWNASHQRKDLDFGMKGVGWKLNKVEIHSSFKTEWWIFGNNNKKRENMSRLWAQIVSHTSWWQLLPRKATRMWKSMNRIMSLYPDIDPAKLPVGKVICIPDAQPFQNDFAKYKIKRGDTFSFDWAKRTQI